VPNAPAKPIRIWMHASENDLGANREESTLRNWVLANQHIPAALRMQGYTYRYVFAEGAGHVDDAVFNQTLPSGSSGSGNDMGRDNRCHLATPTELPSELPASLPACGSVNMCAATSLRARHVPRLEPPQSARAICSASSSAADADGCRWVDGLRS
jgi:hypothetical protein